MRNMETVRAVAVAAYAFAACAADVAPSAKPQARAVVNVVNFVRGCEPRRPMDLVTPLAKEIECNTRHGLPNTILLQYDAMLRDDIMSVARTADPQKTEYGVWIEIVRPLCDAVGIEWRGQEGWDWDYRVVPGFLEAYDPPDRAKLIDELFRLFREKFGHVPESAGSWIMDAWSIGYMKDKYGISAVCICREQDNTDAYGLRGGYSNGAYYPSRKNMLSAARDMANGIRVPVFRMLTPDPIYNYGHGFKFRDSRTGKLRGHVVTLEPAGMGRNPYMVDWYFRTYADRRGMLNLSYMQAGQENSFGWREFGVDIGYPAQATAIRRHVDAGLIEVETLGETGRRFAADHPENCPQTQVALEDWMGKGRRSVWYNCKNYRANLYQDSNRFFIRDIHKMCDDFAEDHLCAATTNWNELIFTPPVVDAYMFGTNGASGMLEFKGEAIGMLVRPNGGEGLEVECFYADGLKATVLFDQSGIVVRGTPLEIKMRPEWRAAHTFSCGRIGLTFKGYEYSVGCEGRVEPLRDGYRIEPGNGGIRLDMSL